MLQLFFIQLLIVPIVVLIQGSFAVLVELAYSNSDHSVAWIFMIAFTLSSTLLTVAAAIRYGRNRKQAYWLHVVGLVPALIMLISWIPLALVSAWLFYPSVIGDDAETSRKKTWYKVKLISGTVFIVFIGALLLNIPYNFSKIRFLPEPVLRILLKYNTTDLVIDAQTEIDPVMAQAIQKHKGGTINLKNVDSISPGVLRIFTQLEAPYPGFTQQKAPEVEIDHGDKLSLTTLQLLGTFQSYGLTIKELTNLNSDQAKALAPYAGRLVLTDLVSLDVSSARILVAQPKTEIRLPNIQKISSETIGVLESAHGILITLPD